MRQRIQNQGGVHIVTFVVSVANLLFFRAAAGLLMNFSQGCDAVLGLMGAPKAPSSPSGTSCSSDGYHSDSADSLPDDARWEN